MRRSLLALLLAGCSGSPTDIVTDPVTTTEVLNVVGVRDLGKDPSLLVITSDWGELCSAVLVASDVVVTARHCVTAMDDGTCGKAGPSSSPSLLRVYASAPASGATPLAFGAAVLTPSDPALCGADVAVVVLASPVLDVPVSFVSTSGIAQGDYVRVVGWSWPKPNVVPEELLREHVPVLSVTDTEIGVREATCLASGGSAVFNEATGALLAVLSRWGTGCDVPEELDVFTRVDPFYDLVSQAMQWAPTLAASGSPSADGGVPRDAGKHDAGHTKKPVTDIGAACTTGSECGSGICADAEGSQYCTESCSPFDRCPSTFKCVISAVGGSVCVAT
jgi:hypothetical protein